MQSTEHLNFTSYAKTKTCRKISLWPAFHKWRIFRFKNKFSIPSTSCWTDFSLFLLYKHPSWSAGLAFSCWRPMKNFFLTREGLSQRRVLKFRIKATNWHTKWKSEKHFSRQTAKTRRFTHTHVPSTAERTWTNINHCYPQQRLSHPSDLLFVFGVTVTARRTHSRRTPTGQDTGWMSARESANRAPLLRTLRHWLGCLNPTRDWPARRWNFCQPPSCQSTVITKVNLFIR